MGMGKAPPSCCWGRISVKTASLFIGFLDLLHPIAVGVIVGIQGACWDIKSTGITFCVFVALFVISRFWLAGLLIRGCLKNDYEDLWLWLLYQCIIFMPASLIIFIVLIVGAMAIVELDPEVLVAPAFVGIYAIVLGSCIWVVRKFELFLELQSDVPYIRRIGPITMEDCINPEEISMEQRNL